MPMANAAIEPNRIFLIAYSVGWLGPASTISGGRRLLRLQQGLLWTSNLIERSAIV